MDHLYSFVPFTPQPPTDGVCFLFLFVVQGTTDPDNVQDQCKNRANSRLPSLTLLQPSPLVLIPHWRLDN